MISLFQGMGNNVRFALSVGDTTRRFTTRIEQTYRIGDTKVQYFSVTFATYNLQQTPLHVKFKWTFSFFLFLVSPNKSISLVGLCQK